MSRLILFRMKRVSIHVFSFLLRQKGQKAMFTKSGFFFSITGYILSFSGEYSHVVYLGGKSYFTQYFIHCAHAHLIKIKKYSIVQPKCPISNKKKFIYSCMKDGFKESMVIYLSLCLVGRHIRV